MLRESCERRNDRWTLRSKREKHTDKADYASLYAEHARNSNFGKTDISASE